MKWLVGGVAVFGVLCAGVAQAHELTCSKTVNGQPVVEVCSYPTSLRFEMTVSNAHPCDASQVLAAKDALLEEEGFCFDPAPPFWLGVGESKTDSFDFVLDSYEACQALAQQCAPDGVMLDGNFLPSAWFDNVFVAAWDYGFALCTARVLCKPPEPPPPPPCGATRTMGFFKTHEEALSQCLDGNPVDLGFVTISTLPQALGLLWGSPSFFEDGERRCELDKARFLLARQTLVGMCNVRLFGAVPSPSNLVSQAVAALGGTDCELVKDLAEQVDGFNNSNDETPFPIDFQPGPATPQDAKAKADDLTGPSGESCSD